MTVIIRDLDKPAECDGCKFCLKDHGRDYCVFDGEYIDWADGTINLDCPLEEYEEPGWIPFKVRDLTDEEQEEHPEWSFIVDCKLPENGQRILVSIDIAGHERVQFDEFYDDDGVYLDSGYEIGEEAVAWMPLPNPYQEGSE